MQVSRGTVIEPAGGWGGSQTGHQRPQVACVFRFVAHQPFMFDLLHARLRNDNEMQESMQFETILKLQVRRCYPRDC